MTRNSRTVMRKSDAAVATAVTDRVMKSLSRSTSDMIARSIIDAIPTDAVIDLVVRKIFAVIDIRLKTTDSFRTHVLEYAAEHAIFDNPWKRVIFQKNRLVETDHIYGRGGVTSPLAAYTPFALPSGARAILRREQLNEITNIEEMTIYTKKKHLAELKDVLQMLYNKHSEYRTRFIHVSAAYERDDGKRNGWVKRAAEIPSLKQVPLNSQTRIELMEILHRVKEHWDQDDPIKQDYRQSIILYGDYGTGKTTLAAGIARYLQSRFYIMNPDLTSSQFWSLADMIGKRGTVLFDEADKTGLFTAEYDNQSRTFLAAGTAAVNARDVLNYLTGPQAPAGVFNVIVTNDYSKFQEGFLRDGRGGDRICVRDIDDAGMKYYLKHRFGWENFSNVEFADIRSCNYFKLEALCRYDVNEIVEKLPKKR